MAYKAEKFIYLFFFKKKKREREIIHQKHHKLVVKAQQTFECRVECKIFNLGINLEFISIAAAMCITWRNKKET